MCTRHAVPPTFPCSPSCPLFSRGPQLLACAVTDALASWATRGSEQSEGGTPAPSPVCEWEAGHEEPRTFSGRPNPPQPGQMVPWGGLLGSWETGSSPPALTGPAKPPGSPARPLLKGGLPGWRRFSGFKWIVLIMAQFSSSFS